MGPLFVKPHNIVLSMFIFTLIIIMGGNSANPDFSAYETLYYNAINYSFNNFWDPYLARTIGYSRDFGYAFTNYLGNELGLDYQEYKVLSSAIFIIFFFLYANKMLGKKTVVFAFLYALYPFLMDIIQVRNFMLLVFIFAAFYYLEYADSYKKLKFCICILIATSFHSVALLYLPFIIFRYFIRKNKYKMFIYCLLAIGFLMPFYAEWMRGKWLAIGLLLSSSSTSISHYSGYVYTNYGLSYLARYFMLCILSCWLYVLKKKNNSSFRDIEQKYVDNIFLLSLYMFLFVPLFPLFNDLAVRLLRNLLPFIYVTGIMFVKRKCRWEVKYFIISTLCLYAVVIGWLGLYNANLRSVVPTIIIENVFYR